MKLFFRVAVAALAMVGTGFAHGEAPPVEVTLKGEVLDLHCYMLHPDTGQGMDHAKCANSCIERGLPVGFLADGKVYALLGAGHDAPTAMVAGKAGKMVQLTGKLVENGGMRAIQLISVTELDGSAPKVMPSTAPSGGDHKGHNH